MRALPPAADPNVFTLDDDTIVTTVNFVPPVVDDPYDYGRIVAAAALSTVYARGAQPLCALAIAAFPEQLDSSVVASVLRGGVDKCAEAGVPVVGGHTIKGAEPKYGLSVTGIVRNARPARAGSARAGDVLMLTKPLGTGILTWARHADAIGDDELAPAIESMLELNGSAAEAALRHGVRAMIDVDDLGLLGRLREMLGDEVGAFVDAGTVPIFPRALALAAHDAVPAAARANVRDARVAGARFAVELPLGLRAVLCDAQTSGGLLIAAPPDRADALLAELQAHARGAHAIGTIAHVPGIEVAWRPAKP